jgi:hypothetical protein
LFKPTPPWNRPAQLKSNFAVTIFGRNGDVRRRM